MKGTITLTLGSLSITLTRFTEGTFPREKIQVTGVSFSAYGTPATDGTSYESPHIWNLTVLVSFEDAEIIQRIVARSEAQRTDVLIYDNADNYCEPVPRSRAIAPGGVEVIDDSDVIYPARFRGRFTAPIKQVKEGKFKRVTLQITETTKVAA